MAEAHRQKVLTISTQGQGLYEFTGEAQAFVRGVNLGLLTLFVRHTSASIIIQENADPDVQRDMKEFFSRLVPEHMSWLRHTCEGPDDMPAHIKSALTATSVSVPISNGALVLGTWQGLYLFEHRAHVHQRQVVLHISG
jgi:secondary thiamine-phosphate synthase enzyme